MILENGHITLYTKSGGGVDSENNPVPPTLVEVNVPCQYQQKSSSNNGEYVGGKYASASYEVFIDIAHKDSVLNSAKFKLYGEIAGDLGEYQIAKADFLDLVGQIKISV